MTEIICWEALDAADKALAPARRLYETTQAPDERIPWHWIEGGVARRRSWRPGRWATHLLLAAPRARRTTVCGFACGVHLPGYGGYLAYVGVGPRQRRRGVGGLLIRLLTHLLQADAVCEGTPLPFVIWESRRPAADAADGERALWRARLRLFERAGALWIAGVDFLATNYHRRQAPPIPVQLFLLPVNAPAESLDNAALRAAAAGLLREVYGRGPEDDVFQRVLPAGSRPRLRPVSAALAAP